MFADPDRSLLTVDLEVIGEVCQGLIVKKAARLCFVALDSTQLHRQRFPKAGFFVFNDLQYMLCHLFVSL